MNNVNNVDIKKIYQWDLLILTAGNKVQKIFFEKQISPIYFKYFKKFFVIEDSSNKTKIGV